MKKKGFRSGVVCQLLGLTYKRIEYYDQQGIVSPEISKAKGRGSRRLFSHGNLAELNVLKKLLDRGVSLSKVRRAVESAKVIFPDVKKPLRELRFLSDGNTIYTYEGSNAVILDLLNPAQTILGPAVVDTAEMLNGAIHEIDTARIETVSFKGRTYLIEVVEESGGKEVLARCPDLYGVSVKGKDVDDALVKMVKRIQDAIEHLHN